LLWISPFSLFFRENFSPLNEKGELIMKKIIAIVGVVAVVGIVATAGIIAYRAKQDK